MRDFQFIKLIDLNQTDVLNYSILQHFSVQVMHAILSLYTYDGFGGM